MRPWFEPTSAYFNCIRTGDTLCSHGYQLIIVIIHDDNFMKIIGHRFCLANMMKKVRSQSFKKISHHGRPKSRPSVWFFLRPARRCHSSRWWPSTNFRPSKTTTFRRLNVTSKLRSLNDHDSNITRQIFYLKIYLVSFSSESLGLIFKLARRLSLIISYLLLLCNLYAIAVCQFYSCTLVYLGSRYITSQIYHHYYQH